jgi:3'-phosphoadenosine 5'-phosphosulfate sulfotransferase (PAPS reductase)/FAD synthetase
MIEPHIQSAMNLLKLVRAETDAIGVAVSFGKDSLCTLDLCCRLFVKVEAFYLFRVRDLEIVQRWSAEVLERYGVSVRQYPHFDLSRCYDNSVFQPHWARGAVRVRWADMEAHFREQAKIAWIAYGWRRNDSFSRALIMKKCRGWDPAARRVYPLRAWRRAQVYEYLDSQGIARPDTLGRKEQGGLDFHPEALRALGEVDRRKWLEDFPFAVIQLGSPSNETKTSRNKPATSVVS